MTARRQKYRLRQLFPPHTPSIEETHKAFVSGRMTKQELKVFYDWVAARGWKVRHINFRGNCYERGDERITMFNGIIKYNDTHIGREEVLALMKRTRFYTAAFRYSQRKDEFSRGDDIPSVIKENYPAAFRYVTSESELYVCERDGKKGITDRNGRELIPCLQDEIYEQIDTDGIIPFIRAGKWGMYHFGVCTDAVFDDIMITSEDYCRVKLDGQWGWVNIDGEFTLDESDAWFGSWYDFEK